VISLVAVTALATCLAGSALGVEWRPGVPLTRDGAQLLYDGKPFAAVGVNKHELLDEYMAKLLGRPDEECEQALAAARGSLQRLSELGISVVRVRASGFWPAQIERTYLSEDADTRAAFWAALDALMDDCDRYGLRVIPTIAWHLGAWADLGHESLADLLTNPLSAGRGLLGRWVEELVTRYHDRDTVLFWELTNEANLLADLRPQFAEEGVLQPKLDRPAPHLVTGPVIRDGRNNFSSEELAALTRELCAGIKSLDPVHLVGTGFSAPRPAAWHLWLGSLRRADRMDWTTDTPEEQADALRLITPEAVDLVSLHTYGWQGERILDLKLAADSMAKPVYVGELGVSAQAFEGPVYDSVEAAEGLGVLLRAMREMRVPLVLLWTWDEWGTPIHEPVLRPDTQPGVVEALRQGNQDAQREAWQPMPEPQGLLGRLLELSAAYEALVPERK